MNQLIRMMIGVFLFVGCLLSTSVAMAAIDTSAWSCGNLTEIQTRLAALQTACAVPVAKSVCRAGSGVGDHIAAAIKDCVRGGMPELTCARIVACGNGTKVCSAGGYRADSEVDAVALCLKGSVGAGSAICQQTVSCQ
ncbi:MAG: hypothetical protein H7301_11030 [Cryobacterium sp.]|nr:hypothetical protein [Oligoflexia bacterium]